jgi:hypothetical protein
MRVFHLATWVLLHGKQYPTIQQNPAPNSIARAPIRPHYCRALLCRSGGGIWSVSIILGLGYLFWGEVIVLVTLCVSDQFTTLLFICLHAREDADIPALRTWWSNGISWNASDSKWHKLIRASWTKDQQFYSLNDTFFTGTQSPPIPCVNVGKRAAWKSVVLWDYKSSFPVQWIQFDQMYIIDKLTSRIVSSHHFHDDISDTVGKNLHDLDYGKRWIWTEGSKCECELLGETTIEVASWWWYGSFQISKACSVWSLAQPLIPWVTHSRWQMSLISDSQGAIFEIFWRRLIIWRILSLRGRVF